MSGVLGAMATVFGLGVVYFLAAIPTGVVALKLHPVNAAICAWAGYTAIGAAMLFLGAPARNWLNAKLKISSTPDPKKLFWRVWNRWGMPGLGLLAPVTIGPYFAALIALLLKEKAGRILFWVAVGVIPWCIIFAAAATTLARILKIST
jgi:hypothetical protein